MLGVVASTCAPPLGRLITKTGNDVVRLRSSAPDVERVVVQPGKNTRVRKDYGFAIERPVLSR